MAVVRGHDGFVIFILSIMLSPATGLLITLGSPINQLVLDKKGVKSGKLKMCNYCKEYIKSDAIKCKHCHDNF